MFLTNILLKKVKSKTVMIVMESTVTGHKYVTMRLRTADKSEVIRFDPYVQMPVIYKELKKLRGLKSVAADDA